MPQLHSQIIGNGTPLLILHGFLGMSDNWKTLGGRYAEAGYQAHLIDQRNHGRSFHSEAFDYELLADDIKAYMEDHQLSEAIVLGHSMGGKTAMQLACSHPEKVSKLLVADIAPKYYPPHHQLIFEGLQSLDMDQIQSRSEAETELAKTIKDFGTRQFLLKNLYWEEKGKLGFRMNLPVLAEKMEEVGEPISPTAVYQGPTLFLRGGRSPYISNGDEVTILKHFPKAHITTIPDAGHWLHAEQPQLFFNATLNFMDSQ